MTENLTGDAQYAVQIARRTMSESAVWRALAPRIQKWPMGRSGVVTEAVMPRLRRPRPGLPPVEVHEHHIRLEPVALWPHRVVYLGYSDNSHTVYIRGEVTDAEAQVLATLAAAGLMPAFGDVAHARVRDILWDEECEDGNQ